MFAITNVTNAIIGFFESIAKARVNSVLLGMGREKVEEFGYSYDALQLGPDAWPWREMPQNNTKEACNRHADEKNEAFISKSSDAIPLNIRSSESTSIYGYSESILPAEIKKRVA
jgi:hypothetical protein